jgi:hypothetical protein
MKFKFDNKILIQKDEHQVSLYTGVRMGALL